MAFSEKHVRIAADRQAQSCLLCHDAPCTAACIKGKDPASFIRALRFSDMYGAAGAGMAESCAGCPAPCEKACISFPVHTAIRDIASSVISAGGPAPAADLHTEFCGRSCPNPFLLSSSIVSATYDMCARALEAGWGGVVFKTIGFIRPREVSPRFDVIGGSFGSFAGLRNLEQISQEPLEEDLRAISALKRDFPDRLIVSSIMGSDTGEWAELARLSQEAGADMIECNFSCPHMSGRGLGSDTGVDPEAVSLYTAAVKAASELPVMAKMTPNLTDITEPAAAAKKAGADAIAAINTVKSLGEINLDNMSPAPDIKGCSAVSGYSGRAVRPIALRYIAELAKCPGLGLPLSGMGGIYTWHDAAEFIALGCSTVQVTTAVMEYGYRVIDNLTTGLAGFMGEKGFRSIDELKGQALDAIKSTTELDRKSVVYPVFERELCTGCGRCCISCTDAGHQALSFGSGRRPVFDGSKCVGCQLCALVCPSGAVGQSRRAAK